MIITDMEMPPGNCKKHVLTYYEGFSRIVYTTDNHFLFPDGKLIVSRTDLKGVITHANRAFVEISGYKEEELIGTLHSILRHPDIPRAAFQDLWQTVQAGKKWHGYVKNLRKDGGYYWVYATVIPNIREGKIVSYTSVRRKISQKKIDYYTEAYAKMLAEEKSNN